MKKRGPWKIKKTRVVYKNPWITVREDSVLRPDGKPGIFGVVTMLPGVSVIPLDENGNVYLTKEFHYGVGRTTIEAISGGIEKGENLLKTAKRELKEETGLTAKKWTYLGVVDPFTTVVNSSNHIYLAEQLNHGKSNPEGTEKIKVIKMPFKNGLKMVLDSKITHCATCVAILKIGRLRF
ncbi:NUDIX hydrolase [Candidatus Giovannonibacteria bacterium]|nr:NUDIX hydrolase [Candidatus Giovannonibacteria bacterium]